MDFHWGNRQMDCYDCGLPATVPLPNGAQFLILLGRYSRFVFNYSHLSSPLTDLIKEGTVDLLRWLEESQRVFGSAKVVLFPLQ